MNDKFEVLENIITIDYLSLLGVSYFYEDNYKESYKYLSYAIRKLYDNYSNFKYTESLFITILLYEKIGDTEKAVSLYNDLQQRFCNNKHFNKISKKHSKIINNLVK